MSGAWARHHRSARPLKRLDRVALISRKRTYLPPLGKGSSSQGQLIRVSNRERGQVQPVVRDRPREVLHVELTDDVVERRAQVEEKVTENHRDLPRGEFPCLGEETEDLSLSLACDRQRVGVDRVVMWVAGSTSVTRAPSAW
jgi:hypothetical protein